MRTVHRQDPAPPVQVLFGLPASEATLCAVPCWLDPHGVGGTAFLTSGHVAFSSASISGAGTAAASLCHRLSRVAAVAEGYVGRSRALAFTLADKTQFTLYKFEGAQRTALLDALRAHVAGTNSTLDRQLRGVLAAVAAATLQLPPGEQIARSYACVLQRTVRSRRGVLYVLSRELVFVAGARREHVALLAIDRVELSRGRWSGQPSVHVACDNPPRRFEVRLSVMRKPHTNHNTSQMNLTAVPSPNMSAALTEARVGPSGCLECISGHAEVLTTSASTPSDGARALHAAL